MTRLVATAFAACLTLFASTSAVQAQDAKAGERKIASCIGCHGIIGYQSSFPEVHRVPMIAGQGAKYLVAALTAYQKGDRKHPTMRGIATTLSDADMADIAAYYEAQPGVPVVNDDTPPAPSAEVAALLAKGACVSCHGASYNKPIDPTYPKIAGQYADYLYVALKSYKSESSPQVGRNNAIMSAQVKQFSNAELKAMAKYIGSLPGDLRTIPQSKFR